jgi:hypothetical protein
VESNYRKDNCQQDTHTRVKCVSAQEKIYVHTKLQKLSVAGL